MSWGGSIRIEMNVNIQSNLWGSGWEVYEIRGSLQLKSGAYHYSGDVSSDIGYKIEY